MTNQVNAQASEADLDSAFIGHDDYALVRVPESERYSWFSVALQRFGQLSALAQFFLAAMIGLTMGFWQAMLAITIDRLWTLRLRTGWRRHGNQPHWLVRSAKRSLRQRLGIDLRWTFMGVVHRRRHRGDFDRGLRVRFDELGCLRHGASVLAAVCLQPQRSLEVAQPV